VAANRAQRNALWKARRAIREAITSESPEFLAEDTVVPRAAIPLFLRELKGRFERQNLRSVMFGHAGDGNVHVDVLRDTMSGEEWRRRLPEIKRMIYETAITYGGTISGEHGIGVLKKEYLGMACGESDIRLMRRIKEAFDPRGILNPGKIV
jgi:glycolate oxidase